MMPLPDSKLIAGGLARLVGTHLTACSNQPAGADRWCAFSRPGRVISRTELWVVNITKAVAGTVRCDGMDSNCLRLHENLWTGQPEAGPAHPTSHRFDGETLVFYANAPTNVDLYAGPIFAWRAGWPEPRQISAGNRALDCSVHFRTDALVCIEDVTPENVMPLQFNLTAGRLQGGAKMVARITPVRPGTQASQWRTGFSRDGQWFAYSTGGRMAAERETLHVMRVDDIGNAEKVMMVGAGISRWNISLDGKKWYYYRNYNYSTEGDPSGTLTMADFPSGANEVALLPNAGVYQLLSNAEDQDRGVAYLDRVLDSKGTFKILKDPTKSPDDAANVTEVARNIGSVPVFSPDLRYSYFAKDFDEDVGTSDSWVARNDGSGSCDLTRALTSSIFGSPFLRNGGLVFWVDNIDIDTDSGEGWLAEPQDCRTQRKKFSNAIDFWFLYRDEMMVYSDESDGFVVTLRFAPIANGKNWPAQPTIVQRGVERLFAVLPNFEGVLFNIASGADDVDGLYYYKLPAAGSAPRDGGATDAGRADAGAADAGAADASGAVDAVSGADAVGQAADASTD
jgi:hypothetical protein